MTSDYSTDLFCHAMKADGETGVSVFLTHLQRIDLSITDLGANGSLAPHLRRRAATVDEGNYTAPEASVVF